MNILLKSYYRTYQFMSKMAIPFLPYRKPNLLDSINDFSLIPHYAILAKNSWIALESDTNEVASVKFIEWIISSNEEMAIPKVIYDIKKEDIQSMATYAYKEAYPLYSVPRLFDKKDIENIYLEVCR